MQFVGCVIDNYICNPAQVAKLVDALPSGGSVRKDVLVRIRSWAQIKKQFIFELLFYLIEIIASKKHQTQSGSMCR